MHASDSGCAHGTGGSPQTTIEQLDLGIKAKEAEDKAKEREEYLRNELPKTSPLKIPPNAVIKDEKKNGYDQVKDRKSVV